MKNLIKKSVYVVLLASFCSANTYCGIEEKQTYGQWFRTQGKNLVQKFNESKFYQKALDKADSCLEKVDSFLDKTTKKMDQKKVENLKKWAKRLNTCAYVSVAGSSLLGGLLLRSHFLTSGIEAAIICKALNDVNVFNLNQKLNWLKTKFNESKFHQKIATIDFKKLSEKLCMMGLAASCIDGIKGGALHNLRKKSGWIVPMSIIVEALLNYNCFSFINKTLNSTPITPTIYNVSDEYSNEYKYNNKEESL